MSWSEDDQDKALAYMRAKLEICPECGTRESEWAEEQYAYVAHPTRCRGCETIEIERDAIKQMVQEGGSDHGIKVGLIKPQPEEEEEKEED